MAETVGHKDVLARDVWCLMGLPFDAVSQAQAASELERSILNRRSCFLSTPNLNFVVSAQSEHDFFESVLDSDLVVADGMPIVWVAKLLGIPISERVAGSSLFNALSTREPANGRIKVFFFGGLPGVAEGACDALNSMSEGMECCGYADPGFVSVDDMSSPDILDKINRTKPDFLVVALGAKKGQAWIQKNKDLLKVPVFSHLGAVINFVAGTVERAPKVWQKLGLEWLWRIKQEPALWRRYLTDGVLFVKFLVFNIIPLWLLNKITLLFSNVEDRPEIAWQDDDETCISLKGVVDDRYRDQVINCFMTVRDELDSNVVIDCTNLEFIDSACIASLLLFQSELKKRNRTLTIKHLGWRTRLIFKLNQVWKRF